AGPGTHHFAPYIGHGRPGETEDRCAPAPAGYALADRLRDFPVVDRNIVKRAVRLHMHDSSAEPPDDDVQSLDLFEHGLRDFGGTHRHLDAPEIRPVPIARMRADSHFALEGQARCTFHGGIVARVAAACDVGGCDVLHQGRFVSGIRQLTHVTVEIDGHHTKEYSQRSCDCRRRRACSTVTHSNWI